jgi:hypothetical protein
MCSAIFFGIGHPRAFSGMASDASDAAWLASGYSVEKEHASTLTGLVRSRDDFWGEIVDGDASSKVFVELGR